MKTFLRALIAGASLPVLAAASSGLLIGGGLNFSRTDLNDADGIEYSSRLGFNAGIAFEKQVAGAFYLAPGIGLETRGEKIEGVYPFFGEVEGELKLLYLQMPVLAVIKVPAGRASLQFFAGPSLGVNLSSEIEMSLGGETETTDNKDDTEAIDFGLEFGAGVEFPAGGGSLFVRPAYYLGLTEALSTGEKLRNFKLQAGYRIPLGFPAGP